MKSPPPTPFTGAVEDWKQDDGVRVKEKRRCVCDRRIGSSDLRRYWELIGYRNQQRAPTPGRRSPAIIYNKMSEAIEKVRHFETK
jgi:hypothetical protein